MIERQHENVECVDKKISRKKLDFSVQCGVPLHPEGSYTRYHTLLKVWPKFQAFISYSLRVIIFFTEIMKEGAVDLLNGRHFNAPGYLNSWQRMC